MGIMLFFFGLVLGVIGGVWILIEAFQESVSWFAGCLLIPFVHVYFIVTHWQETKNPLICQLVGGFLSGVGVLLMGHAAMPAPQAMAETATEQAAPGTVPGIPDPGFDQRDLVCLAHLKQIGIQVMICAMESEEFPRGLAEAIGADAGSDASVTHCPCGSAQQVGYEYCYPAQGHDTRPKAILAYDRQPHPSGSRAVLRFDGSVAMIEEAVFQGELAEQEVAEHSERAAPVVAVAAAPKLSAAPATTNPERSSATAAPALTPTPAPARSLAERLKDGDRAIRLTACRELENRGPNDPEAIAALSDLLSRETDAGVCRTVAGILEEMGPRASLPLAEFYVRASALSSDFTPRPAIDGLRRLGSAAAPAIAAGLVHEQACVRDFSYRARTDLGLAGQIAFPFAVEGKEHLINAWEDSGMSQDVQRSEEWARFFRGRRQSGGRNGPIVRFQLRAERTQPKKSDAKPGQYVQEEGKVTVGLTVLEVAYGGVLFRSRSGASETRSVRFGAVIGAAHPGQAEEREREYRGEEANAVRCCLRDWIREASRAIEGKAVASTANRDAGGSADAGLTPAGDTPEAVKALRVARNLMLNGAREKALPMLAAIVKSHAGTRSAVEAQQLIDNAAASPTGASK